MSLERGFRRIVVVVSCAIATASLAAVSLESSAVVRYQAQRLAHDRREESFQAWLAEHPISEAQVTARLAAKRPNARFPQFARPSTPDDETLDRLLARGDLERELRWEHARRTGLEGAVMPAEARRVWWDWPASWIVLLGVSAAAVLTALPWGVFYLLGSVSV